MVRRLIAPAAYVQGRDVLDDPATYAPLTGSRAFVLGGETALSNAEAAVTNGLERAGLSVTAVESNVDACTFESIDSLSRTADGADVVVAVGGGVAIDTGKGVAEAVGSELVTVPTVASTDAPCSAVAVVYDESGGFDGYVHRERNPEVVAVDTAVIAAAPERFLRYGMGDALATRFEVEAAARSGADSHAGGTATRAARLLAAESYRNVVEYGETALSAVSRNAVTEAVEIVVEANTLLSGVGFESGGLAAAHAFGKGFTRAGISQPHGELVAFGAIAQLLLEDRDQATISEVVDVCRRLALTSPLEELGAADAVETIARGACADDTTMGNQPQAITPAMAADALRTADELLRR